MTRKVVAKKTTPKKVSVKKSASKKPQGRDPEITPDEVSNEQARVSQDASVYGPPKIHAKVVSLIVSVGTDDRERNWEDFVADVRKKLGIVPYGKPGLHGGPVSGYYILDGKVCLPDDYDEKTGTFKKGAVPPTWAGGPKPNSTSGNTATQEQMTRDAKELSSDEYAKKYKIGKYRQLGTGGKIITAEDQARMAAEDRKRKQQKEDEALEEFEWDEEDVLDEKKMTKVADRSASRAVKVLKKKPAKKTASKRVVRRVKK